VPFERSLVGRPEGAGVAEVQKPGGGWGDPSAVGWGLCGHGVDCRG